MYTSGELQEQREQKNYNTACVWKNTNSQHINERESYISQ